MATLHVLVPVFNEAPNIPTLNEAFRALAAELSDRFRLSFIIVDDGSTDETVAVARREAAGLELTVLAHEVNKGPGAAFATGFTHLAGVMAPDDWVITMEGDNTSRHELIRQGAKLVENVEDVLAELKISLSAQLLADAATSPPDTGKPGSALDKEYKILLDALAFEPASVDSLIERTGMNSESIASMLLILELDGHVAPHPGGRYSRLAER